jgi:periplasmic protein CpxP/Spy
MQKPMFSLALSAILFAGMTSGAVFAQTDNSAQQPAAANQSAPASGGESRHAMDPEKQVKHLSKRLKLTGDQQNQIRPILVDRQQHMQALRQDQSLSPQDRMTKAKSVRDDSNAKIEAVLNDQQKQQFEQMQQHMREHFQQRRGAASQDAAPSPQQ